MARRLIEVEDARRLVLGRAATLGSEPVGLRGALGRVLAEDVSSADAVPGFDNSAMDGFAVRATDTTGARTEAPAALRIVGESQAGSPADVPVDRGQAVAISTGAMLPRGADSVVPIEDANAVNGRVDVRIEVPAGRHVRRAGEDIAEGERVMTVGTRIGPAELGVLASVGRASVRCFRRPRARVVTTGSELVEPGEPVSPGSIRNSNSYSVPSLALEAGAELAGVETVGDDRGETRGVVERAFDADLTLICGGVSVGEHDHVRPVLAELGVEEVFWGVALKPGKPTWFGVAPSGALVFGLPGNPVSAMVTFLLFARPAVAAMSATARGAQRIEAILDRPLAKQPGRAHAIRCRLDLREDGWHARPTGEQGSHVLTSMLGADGLALLPEDRDDLAAGELVTVELIPGGRLASWR